jgi:dolichyl-diphosphooligosaccharide--protein glycosyltransferase
VIHLLPIYVLVLLLAGRWSPRVYVAYSAFYVLSTLLTVQLRHVGVHYVQAGEHLAAGLAFAFLQVGFQNGTVCGF